MVCVWIYNVIERGGYEGSIFWNFSRSVGIGGRWKFIMSIVCNVLFRGGICLIKVIIRKFLGCKEMFRLNF